MPVTAMSKNCLPLAGQAQIHFGRRHPAVPAAIDPRPPRENGRQVLNRRFDDALVFASSLHRDQRRKGTAIPYISHLLSVSALALELGADEDQAIAALLHDAVEDQGGQLILDDIVVRFGQRVGRIVDDCTQWEPAEDDGSISAWRRSRFAYIASLPAKPSDSLLVSLCDKTHNARTILDDLRAHGSSVWDRFHAGRDGTLWYYQTLAGLFLRILPGPGSDRLLDTVDQISAEC